MSTAREAVFLAEMGIGPLWQLRRQNAGVEQENAVQAIEQAVQVQAPAVPAPAARVLSAPPYRDPEPAPGAPAWTEPPVVPAAPGIEELDWDGLARAIEGCTRCSACAGERSRVPGSGPRQARWLVASSQPSAIDEAEGRVLSGEPGVLLDNMLLAVGLTRARDVYVTPLLKCRPVNARGGERAPSAEEVAACRPYLERELALSGATTILTLGQVAANALLERPLPTPLAEARGSVHTVQQAQLVATLHPAELLLRGADKALAWADLCRARAQDAQH